MFRILLAVLLVSTSFPASAAEAGKALRTRTVKVVAGRFYPVAERFKKNDQLVGAKLKVMDLAGDKKTADYLYVTEDSEIVIDGVGSFRFGGMTENQFKRLFAKARVVTVLQSDCALADERLGCVRSLVVAPKAAPDTASASVAPPPF